MASRSQMIERAFDRVLEWIKEGRSIEPEITEALLVLARLGAKKCHCATCLWHTDQFLTLVFGDDAKSKEGINHASSTVCSTEAPPFAAIAGS
jgi:hypothetical protein